MLRMKSKRILCYFYGCDKEAVGEAYLGGLLRSGIPIAKNI